MPEEDKQWASNYIEGQMMKASLTNYHYCDIRLMSIFPKYPLIMEWNYWIDW